jgi:outer membrane lipoprotein SlyB
MRTPLLCAALASVALTGCTTYDDGSYHRGDGYYARGDRDGDRDWGRDYRDGNYEPYALGPDDRVYRGEDGRYYCRRHDGSVGLVVGAGVGAVLGNVIAPRGSGLLGALLGGAAGAAVGASVDASNRDIRCR